MADQPDDRPTLAFREGSVHGLVGRQGLAVILTDGEASHPRSPTHSPARLADLRRRECVAAVRLLAPEAELRQPGMPDGHLRAHRADVVGQVEAALADDGDHQSATGAGLLVVSTWRHDGHPDHDVVGEVVADVCSRRGVRHLEAPIWWWAWRDAEALPWQRVTCHVLDSDGMAAKAAAMEVHVSQVRPLSILPGDEAIVPEEVMAHFRRPWEAFVEAVPHRPATSGSSPGGTADLPDRHAVFDQMYAATDDPWGFEGSWSEERKRAVTLAALPQRPLGRVLEVGPGTGLLTHELASRADHLLAMDISAEALTRVARRLANHPRRGQVDLRVGDIAQHFPPGEFDTIVLSEVGYFLTPEEWSSVLIAARESLSPNASLLLVHWRHPLSGWPMDGDEVHQRAHTLLDLASTVSHVEEDFVLHVFRPPGLPSPARQEGRC